MFCKLAFNKSDLVVKECMIAMDSLTSLQIHIKQDDIIAWCMLVAASISVVLSAVAIKDDLVALGKQALRKLTRPRA